MNKITFRIDDVGASTKHFNQHGRKTLKIFGRYIPIFPFANIGFVKRLPFFRRWGSYEELTDQEWKVFLKIFKDNHLIPIVAITACWVNERSELVPFPEKFPLEAACLKAAAYRGEIIIANHGLTHCVVGKHMPRFLSSNREFHREFWPYLDQEIHTDHIIKSQKILEDFFERPIEIFVPPGNLWSHKTYLALKGTSIKKVMCNKYMIDSDQKMDDIVFVKDTDGVMAFHDRELKLYGVKWLINLLEGL